MAAVVSRVDGEVVELAPGMTVRVFYSGATGGSRLTTCAAQLAPGCQLPYHTHPCSESITVLAGEAEAMVDGRLYRLRPFDSVHAPRDVPHSVRNGTSEGLILHTTFATDAPERDFVEDNFGCEERTATDDTVPEDVARSADVDRTSVGQSSISTLFAASRGSVGICGGHLQLPPGASLTVNSGDAEESFTVATGRAVLSVDDTSHDLGAAETLSVGPHTEVKLANPGETSVDLIWAASGDEASHTLS